MGNAFNKNADLYNKTDLYKNIAQWAISENFRSDVKNQYGFDNNEDIFSEHYKKRACCSGTNFFLLPFPAFVSPDKFSPLKLDNKYIYKLKEGDISDSKFVGTYFSQYGIDLSPLNNNNIEKNIPECVSIKDPKINYSSGLNIDNSIKDTSKGDGGVTFNTLGICANFYQSLTEEYKNNQGNYYVKTDTNNKKYDSLYVPDFMTAGKTTNNLNYNKDALCAMSPFLLDPTVTKMFTESQSGNDLAYQYDIFCSNNKSTTFKPNIPKNITINNCNQFTEIKGKITAQGQVSIPQKCVFGGSTSKDDTSKDDTSKDDTSKDDTSKDDTSKDDTSKDDTSKDDTSKDNTSKDDTSKDNTSKDDTSKDNTSKYKNTATSKDKNTATSTTNPTTESNSSFMSKQNIIIGVCIFIGLLIIIGLLFAL